MAFKGCICLPISVQGVRRLESLRNPDLLRSCTSCDLHHLRSIAPLGWFVAELWSDCRAHGIRVLHHEFHHVFAQLPENTHRGCSEGFDSVFIGFTGLGFRV